MPNVLWTLFLIAGLDWIGLWKYNEWSWKYQKYGMQLNLHNFIFLVLSLVLSMSWWYMTQTANMLVHMFCVFRAQYGTKDQYDTSGETSFQLFWAHVFWSSSDRVFFLSPFFQVIIFEELGVEFSVSPNKKNVYKIF